jgi:hypothetical protein
MAAELFLAAMQTSVGVGVEFGFIMFTFFVMAPAIAAAVGYAAWKGKPKNFDREMYWTAFVSTGAVAGFVFVYAQRHAETWPRVVQLACLGLCGVLMGVALGFGVGIFTRRHTPLPEP